MKNMQEIENKAFQYGKHQNGSTLSVSYIPLYIDARGKEGNREKKIKWKETKHCLLHGEAFHWKNRCRRCHYLISFHIERG